MAIPSFLDIAENHPSTFNTIQLYKWPSLPAAFSGHPSVYNKRVPSVPLPVLFGLNIVVLP